jgi:hypothetical protein
MGRPASWRKGDLKWACANTDWRRPETYVLTGTTPLSSFAWEFLRRNQAYRKAVDHPRRASPVEWGLASFLPYELASHRLPQADVQWLPLRAFRLIPDSMSIPVLERGHIAVIFDLRLGLRPEVLDRQLAELRRELQLVKGRESFQNHLSSKGGRTFSRTSLLRCLRFADAVATEPEIPTSELAVELGIDPENRKRLNDVYVQARELVEGGYQRLLDMQLPPARQAPAPLARRKSRSDDPHW